MWEKYVRGVVVFKMFKDALHLLLPIQSTHCEEFQSCLNVLLMTILVLIMNGSFSGYVHILKVIMMLTFPLIPVELDHHKVKIFFT